MSARKSWQVVTLGHLLVKSDDVIELDAEQEYKELTCSGTLEMTTFA